MKDLEFEELRRQFRSWLADPAVVHTGFVDTILTGQKLLCIRHHLVMADHKTVSVQSSDFHYCTPGSTFEVYCWSDGHDPFDCYEGESAGHVSEDAVLAYVQSHGGLFQTYGVDDDL